MTLGHELVGHGKEPVIALHDWMSTHRSYEDVRPYLDQSRFCYAFADQRGYGYSRSLRGTHSLEEAANDVVALADALGWSRFHLLGHSMNGMVAQWIATRHPDRLHSLVLVTPVLASGFPLDEQSRAHFTSAATQDESWTSIARMVTAERNGEGWYAEKLRRFRAGVDPEAFLGFLNMWSSNDFADEFTEVNTPTLVISGTHDIDPWKPAAHKAFFQPRVKSLQLCELPTGHYPMSETPARFLGVVESFMAAI